jgi:hypothetical protein
MLSTVPITAPSFDETSEFALSVAVADMRRVLRLRETTAAMFLPREGISPCILDCNLMLEEARTLGNINHQEKFTPPSPEEIVHREIKYRA